LDEWPKTSREWPTSSSATAPFPPSAPTKDHIVKKTKDLGWDTLSNGELPRAAEEAAFEVFLTTDKNIRYQQNLADRIIAIVVLGNSRWPVLAKLVSQMNFVG